MGRKTAAVMAVILVGVIVGLGSWFLFFRDSGSEPKTTDTTSQDRGFQGDATRPAELSVPQGSGDGGGNTVESLPELSVPMNQKPAYYIKRLCDAAQMDLNLKQAKNKEQLQKWFVEAPQYMEPYADGDAKLIALMETAKNTNGDAAAIRKECGT